MTLAVAVWHDSPMNTLLTSREAAEQLGVSVRTLDRLDKAGVTKPVRLTPRGQRRYNVADINRLIKDGWTE